MQKFEVIKKGDKLGVCAPSMGCGTEPYYKLRFENAIKKFKKLGHEIKISSHAIGNPLLARSSDAKTRAKEFEQMFFDESIKGIFAVAGGFYEAEILPYINFEAIKKAKNKFFQGFSDNTNLGFLLTTLCDKQTIYGSNFCVFGMKNWHKTIKDNYNFLCGEKVKQISQKKYESTYSHKEGKELSGYILDKTTYPTILSGEKTIKLNGITIGGCLDILSKLCGTKYDKVKEFCKKYKEEKLIWFLESCDLSVLDQSLCLLQLKNAGWFDTAQAIIIGRPLNTKPLFDVNYKTACYEQLKDLNIPVIIDLDIGHTSPNWFMINGGRATFELNGKTATLIYNN